MIEEVKPNNRSVMFANLETAIRVESGSSAYVDGISVENCGKFIDADGANEIVVKNVTEINTTPKAKKYFSGWNPNKD